MQERKLEGQAMKSIRNFSAENKRMHIGYIYRVTNYARNQVPLS